MGGGFASDSDEYMNPQQLPMIKGGGNAKMKKHAQNVADAYILNNTNYASPNAGHAIDSNAQLKKSMK